MKRLRSFMPDKIEILAVDLLEKHRPVVNNLRKMANSLGLDFGWHYLLDLTWIINQLGLDTPGQPLKILDAGAGVGVLQWYLASQGAQVLSVDRLDRAHLALRFRGRFRVTGLRAQDLHSMPQTMLSSTMPLKRRLVDLGRGLAGWMGGRAGRGSVTLYHQDLQTLTDIPDNTLDAVVAVSALEHNSPEDLGLVVKELLRTLKPGGKILATLGAARDQDWFHEPSQGWNYSADSLRKHFNLATDTADNYACYNEILAALRECAELRDNLAGFYARSGDNGMPWGKWDPQYLVVGVCKIKT